MVGWASLGSVVAWGVWDAWMGESFGGEDAASPPTDETDSEYTTASTLSPRTQQRLATVKSAALIYAAVLGLSPILKSLTLSTTSDSIWALSTWLLMINVAFFDYSGGGGAQ